MENASKALLMAAGILVGVLILSLAAFLYTDYRTRAGEIGRRNTEQQLAEFNTQYTIYENRDDLTIYDVVNVANMAHENNEQYMYTNVYTTDYKITVYLNSIEIQDYTQEQFDEKIKESLNTPQYKCTAIEFYSDTTGRVKSVRFNST